jgi:predicted alpha/beta superfamily hydrolase
VETLHNVRSPELGNARDVLVYLPPSYARSDRRYPVLYMNDGQSVFDGATALLQEEWGADEAAEALAKKGKELIIVAVENNSARSAEYVPFRAPLNDYEARGEQYVTFLAKTLKPMIDAKYRTLTDRVHTGLAGSSLGGLITLYGALAHPDVFGFAAAFSPSLAVADFSLFDWSRAHPASPSLRVYLDMGDREGSSPARNQMHVELVEDMAKLLKDQGHQTRVVIAKGARHDVDAWAPRLPPVLEWFLTEKP